MSKTINFNNLINIILPPYKRVKNVIDLCLSLIKPIQTLYSTYNLYRTSVLYNTAFTSQVIYLEKLLNDKYNSSGEFPDIYIEDADNIEQVYLTNTEEEVEGLYITNTEEKTGLPEIYLFNRREYEDDYDFIIKMPTGLECDNNEVRAFVNKFKLAGKRFNIT